MITLEDIKSNEDILKLVEAANKSLAAIGYTEHGPRHVGYVSNTAAKILSSLGYDSRTVELAAITGWVHDVGNCVNRFNHGLTGACLMMPILKELGMPMDEVCKVIGAIGNHEEQTGIPVSAISAAIIIADKSDAHRTRVRRGRYDPEDIHDRVNYAIKKNRVVVDRLHKSIRYEMIMDQSSSVMDFFQIYLSRMNLSEKAANFLGCSFDIVINNVKINSYKPAAPAHSLKKGEEEVSEVVQISPSEMPEP